MKLSRLLLLIGACTLSLAATAQWQWIDATGRKVYSDRSPPADIPEKNIVKRPNGAHVSAAPAAAAPAASAASAAASAVKAASAPQLNTKDSELEAKKKQADQAEAAKKKAAEEKVAADKAQNCERAKGNLRTLQSGQRIKQANAQGEPEVMTDESRAAESKRMQDVINSDCAK